MCIHKYILFSYVKWRDKCHFPRRFADSSTGVLLQLQMCLLQFTSNCNGAKSRSPQKSLLYIPLWTFGQLPRVRDGHNARIRVNTWNFVLKFLRYVSISSLAHVYIATLYGGNYVVTYTLTTNFIHERILVPFISASIHQISFLEQLLTGMLCFFTFINGLTLDQDCWIIVFFCTRI